MSSIIVPRVLTRYWSINFERKFPFSKSVYLLIPAEIVSGSPTCPKAPISISTPFSVLGAALEVNDSDPAEIILKPLSHILELQYYCLFSPSTHSRYSHWLRCHSSFQSRSSNT
jgi:hypothetical protein